MVFSGADEGDSPAGWGRGRLCRRAFGDGWLTAAPVEDDQPALQPQWYHRLTLESWLRGIVLRDRTKGEAFAQFFKDNWGGSTKRPGKDQLTTRAFPGRPRGQEIEGYGALGGRMDDDVTAPGTSLPVFELRAPSRQITYAAAQQWALDLFDYVQSLNANPGGGYAHIV